MGAYRFHILINTPTLRLGITNPTKRLSAFAMFSSFAFADQNQNSYNNILVTANCSYKIDYHTYNILCLALAYDVYLLGMYGLTSTMYGLTCGNVSLTSDHVSLTSDHADLTYGNVSLTSDHADLTCDNVSLTSNHADLTCGNVSLTSKHVDLTCSNVSLTSNKHGLHRFIHDFYLNYDKTYFCINQNISSMNINYTTYHKNENYNDDKH